MISFSFKWPWRIVLLAAMLFFFTTNAAAATTRKIGAEYTSDDKITVAWDPSDGAVGYEVKLVMDDKTPVTEYALGRTSETQITIMRPRAGHFTAYVRAYKDAVCQAPPCDPPRLYSTWSESTDEAVGTVDGQPMGWWIYFKVPPPKF